MVYAMVRSASIGFIVWAHHMFTAGFRVDTQVFFMFATMLIAVPTGVKVFTWIATMWGGSMLSRRRCCSRIGFIFLFTIGGFTGLVLANAGVDLPCTTPTTSWRTSTTCCCRRGVRDLRRLLLLVPEDDRQHVHE